MKSFEQLLPELKLGNKKIALIIGAGFHSQFIKNHDPIFNRLKNWNCLLDWLKKEFKYHFENSSDSILDFEKIIINQNNINHSEKSASEIEDEIIDTLVKEIRYLTEVKNIETENSLLEIFNNEYVSDVLNLNFDLLLENKYAERTNTKNWKRLKWVTPELKKQKSKIDFQYRYINNIRFWHPHGDFQHKKSVVLGLRRYGLQLKNLESYRKTYKKRIKKDKNNFVEENWMEVIMNKPILILGANLSINEQDILFALINKKRNFIKSKSDSLDERSHIFQMVENRNTTNLGDLASPLYSNMDFKYQWPKLIKLISNDEI
ncbi:SIR2 family protein [Aquirufa regiilacus]